ncbi:MAG: PEP-CTERM sorting domain-containing protein [Armatimonadota bacterium]
MKTVFSFLMVVSLVFALSVACSAFSDNFEGYAIGDNGSPNWDIQAQPGPNGEPPINNLNWQVTDRVPGDNYFQLYDQTGGWGDRGFVTVAGVTAANFFEEVDVYDAASGEFGLTGAAVNVPQLPACIGFLVNPQAWGGAMYFVNFGWTADPNAGVIIWPNTDTGSGLLQGVYPYITEANPTNRIHMTLTANGLTWTGTMKGYDAQGVQTCSGSLTHTWLPGLVVGGVGFQLNSTAVGGFDNYNLDTTVPEPGSMMALMTGLGFAVAALRKRRA